MMIRGPRKAAAPTTKISDVARLAGVSVATVSRALANPDVVSDETRKRVLDAVRETGYTPNVAARNLRVRKSMMALVVVPDIANAFFSEVLRGIDDALSQQGYGLIIANLDNSTDKEARYVDLAIAGQVDGILLLCGHVIAGGGRSLAEANLPMVGVCERIPGEAFPQVEIDNHRAAEAAVRHLIEGGHRRIAYIAGPASNILDVERRSGYRAAMSSASLPVRPEWVAEGDFTFGAGSRAAQRLFALPAETRPTAVFAANDEMAIGLIKAAEAAGLRVPGDVAVVGFDGISYADFCQPTLTTMVQPRRDLGAVAAAHLCAMMKGRAEPPRMTQLQAELVVRMSSGAPAASS